MTATTGSGDEDLVDYAAIFGVAPTPYFVVSPDLVLLAANDAYLRATGRTRDDLVGRYLFDAFPENPQDDHADGVRNLRASLERVLRTSLPDVMPLQKYDIVDSATGDFVERYWSAMSVPVVAADGSVSAILHRTEDVTEFVRQRDVDTADGQTAAWSSRVQEVEAALLARAQELRDARSAEAEAVRRLGGLAEVALALADAQSVDDLAGVVVERGLAVIGADGGAIAVRQDEEGNLRLCFASMTALTQRRFEHVAADSPLPAAVATRTGEPVFLPDRASGLAWSPEMAQVHATTGLQAWASLPLAAGGRVLGALTVGWRRPHRFSPAERELLGGFAAQCAQALDRVQRLATERREADVARSMAATLQRSLLTAPPEPDHLHVVVRYLPAAQEAQVGGDWFDAFITPDGATNLVIGDVTGHDQYAVAAMGQIRNVLRGVAYTLVRPPAVVLSALDRTLRGLAIDTLATVVLAHVERAPDHEQHGMRRFRWANAGHLPPLLLRPDGTAELLHRPPNLLLGLKPHAVRVDHEVELEPGATVVLYTDGLVERRGESLDVGMERLRSMAQELAYLPLDDLCDALLRRLAPVRDDDIALAAVRAYPEDRPRPPDAGPATVPDTDSPLTPEHILQTSDGDPLADV